jgi:hypothetical protein
LLGALVGRESIARHIGSVRGDLRGAAHGGIFALACLPVYQ